MEAGITQVYAPPFFHYPVKCLYTHIQSIAFSPSFCFFFQAFRASIRKGKRIDLWSITYKNRFSFREKDAKFVRKLIFKAGSPYLCKN